MRNRVANPFGAKTPERQRSISPKSPIPISQDLPLNRSLSQGATSQGVPHGYWKRFMKNRGDYLAEHLQDRKLLSFSAVARAQNMEARSRQSSPVDDVGSPVRLVEPSYTQRLRKENMDKQQGSVFPAGTQSFAKVIRERRSANSSPVPVRRTTSQIGKGPVPMGTGIAAGVVAFS